MAEYILFDGHYVVFFFFAGTGAVPSVSYKLEENVELLPLRVWRTIRAESPFSFNELFREPGGAGGIVE